MAAMFPVSSDVGKKVKWVERNGAAAGADGGAAPLGDVGEPPPQAAQRVASSASANRIARLLAYDTHHAIPITSGHIDCKGERSCEQEF